MRRLPGVAGHGVARQGETREAGDVVHDKTSLRDSAENQLLAHNLTSYVTRV